MEEQDQTDLIDRYLSGEMAGRERSAFELRLGQDPTFRLEVEAQKAVVRSLQEWGNEGLKKKFKQFHSQLAAEETGEREEPASPISLADHQEDEEESQTKVRKMWASPKTWVLAASFTLLLLFGLFWLNRAGFRPPTPAIASAETFRIPIIEKNVESMGFAGEEAVKDSVVVQIIPNESSSLSYRFRDTLQIFTSAFSPQPKILLEIEAKTGRYTLNINDKRYTLEKGFNRIRPLKEEE